MKIVTKKNESGDPFGLGGPFGNQCIRLEE